MYSKRFVRCPQGQQGHSEGSCDQNIYFLSPELLILLQRSMVWWRIVISWIALCKGDKPSFVPRSWFFLCVSFTQIFVLFQVGTYMSIKQTEDDCVYTEPQKESHNLIDFSDATGRQLYDNRKGVELVYLLCCLCTSEFCIMFSSIMCGSLGWVVILCFDAFVLNAFILHFYTKICTYMFKIFKKNIFS